jgi:hypothetical protein
MALEFMCESPEVNEPRRRSPFCVHLQWLGRILK